MLLSIKGIKFKCIPHSLLEHLLRTYIVMESFNYVTKLNHFYVGESGAQSADFHKIQNWAMKIAYILCGLRTSLKNDYWCF
jgi:hypothetical protein